MHSRWSVRNETSDCRAAGFVASASPTGMLTRPKLIDPFQIVAHGEDELYLDRPFPPLIPAYAHDLVALAEGASPQNRTRPRIWSRTTDGWREVSWEEAADRGRRARARPPRARHRRRATPSASSRAHGSNGRSSTSRSPRSALSRRRSTRRAPPAETCYILEHSKAVGCLVEDDEQLAKIDAARPTRLHAGDARRARAPSGATTRAAHPGALDEARARSATTTSSRSSTRRARPARRRPA